MKLFFSVIFLLIVTIFNSAIVSSKDPKIFTPKMITFQCVCCGPARILYPRCVGPVLSNKKNQTFPKLKLPTTKSTVKITAKKSNSDLGSSQNLLCLWLK